MNINRFINYLKFEKRFSDHTVEAYRGDITKFFLFFEDLFGLTSAVEVRPFHLRSYLAALLEEGLAHSTINRKKSSLHRFFSFLVKENLISENPAARLPAMKKMPRLPDIIPVADLEKMFSTPIRDADFWTLRNRVICWFLYATGLRRAELIALKLNQINLDGITFTGKGQKERFIPFSNTLNEVIQLYIERRKELLKEKKAETEFFFFSHSFGELNPKTVYNLVNEELQAYTHVQRKSPHMLRHAFATHLLDEGADISSVQKLLGHAGLGSTQTYTQVSINRLKNAHAAAHPRNKSNSHKNNEL